MPWTQFFFELRSFSQELTDPTQQPIHPTDLKNIHPKTRASKWSAMKDEVEVIFCKVIWKTSPARCVHLLMFASLMLP